MILALAAFTGEFASFYRSSGKARKLRSNPWLCEHRAVELSLGERTIVAAVTGIGPEAASKALSSYLESYERPSMLIVTGCCGALDSALRAGDLILPRRVLTPTASIEISTPLRQQALEVLEQSFAKIYQGDLLSVVEVALTPDSKKLWGEETGALGIEMESHALVEVASKAGIPVLVMRAVIDRLDDEVPALEADFDDWGRPRVWSSLRMALSHPGSIPTLMKMGASFKKAQQNISKGLGLLCSLDIEGSP